MQQKKNMKCIRLTDDALQIINNQIGLTFTQKFNNLLYRFALEIPQKEAEIARLDAEIEKKKKILSKISRETTTKVFRISNLLAEVQKGLDDLSENL